MQLGFFVNQGAGFRLYYYYSKVFCCYHDCRLADFPIAFQCPAMMPVVDQFLVGPSMAAVRSPVSWFANIKFEGLDVMHP